MIYFYQSISPQPIENLHIYLDYFFTQLFLPATLSYTRPNFIQADFLSIVVANNNQLERKLKKIHKVYNELQPHEKTIVANAYTNNNDIVGICNMSTQPTKYIALPIQIRPFVKSLYNDLWRMLSDIKAYTEIKAKCGALKTHFKTFRQTNLKSVCPFCGMDSLMNEQSEIKNEYDHYIPKGKYPFCSINFQNLFPICDTCNKSGQKGQKDIPYIPATITQQVLYFPYDNSTPNHQIKLSITSASFDLSNKNKWALNIDCDPITYRNRKDRWKEIYRIESRYKSKIAGDSYSWKDDILKEYKKKHKRLGFDINEFKGDILDRYENVFMKSNWIIEKCFHEFYLNDPNFDSSITSSV